MDYVAYSKEEKIMSTCPHCFTGTCRRHKQQDNGRSMVKTANAESTLKKLYDQLVGSKLQKLQAEAEKDPTRQHAKDFRKQLDLSRGKSLRKSHKSSLKSKTSAATSSGLNSQALAAINDSDSDLEIERHKRKKHKHSTSSRKRRRKFKGDGDGESIASDDSYRSNYSHDPHKILRHSHKKNKRKKRSRTDDKKAFG
ncbi:hypothetical protein CCR75_009424 [Bremia lactucae]|uniref:Uncharacterized protein n=1 Tax=Bremia lactucae TaxID=4779 RepID=A0A976P090_BRELC|nr:hypothetical protein CCR75_009424 [Bremia lactucae]